MGQYGVTDNGFVIKRMDVIMEEIHQDLTNGFGYNTRLLRPSFLDTLVTTFSAQIYDLWETAQKDYYSKFVSTATGKNLDMAVQYGGISRSGEKRGVYALYCTGDDGTEVRAGVVVATDTLPERRLESMETFSISRKAFHFVTVKVASVQNDMTYEIEINNEAYSYRSGDEATAEKIVNGLKEVITNDEYLVECDGKNLIIRDTVTTRNNILSMSENLTTVSVTTIAKFTTQDYGRIDIPNGLVTKIINNIPGFRSVTNLLTPKLGNSTETDVELRQSYLVKSAIRSNTQLGSIVAELLTNVENVESATGYENYNDYTDQNGLPPHSVELVVEGGDDVDIANAILLRKGGGINTYGKRSVDVTSSDGDTITIHFNRPEYLYLHIKATLHGYRDKLPANYESLAKKSIMEDIRLKAGESLYIQRTTEGIYSTINGITYADMKVAYSSDKNYRPSADEYKAQNIIVTSRQMIVGDSGRIEVLFDADS